ncbi:DUF1206 domain-containing protein [Actinokineospora cianjurensis]|uniref:Uncharacterized protein DUF1206 n=1 Tax=Actinokineospora cianjurensis TaxID=585224 RepID=A0A421B7R5_9PSEU|nr:DUF1206 domain-containing protein [Actinokineospora cianjurensis]RLK60315.1 uncharacterized protein DUF1206 [Actinokineospora cianjurensis]
MTSAVHSAHHNDVVKGLGRAGMACYGAVYVIIAYLALQVAFGSGGQEADQTGALQEIASTPFGAVILWVLAIGLLAFGVWQLLMAAVSYQWHDGKKRVFKRLGAAVRGIVGISLGIAAIRIATGNGSQSGDQKQKEMTARLMELPAGRVIVGLVALVVIGAGIASIVSGFRKSFMKDLETTNLPKPRVVERLGQIGYTAKGLGIAIVGVLLGIAALDANASEAGGLDSALRTLANQPFGTVLLIVVAFGFAAFGTYAIAAAKAHRT